MVKEMDRKRVESSGIVQLTNACKTYLNQHYAEMAT